MVENLHGACKAGDEAAVKRCLAAEVDINKVSPAGSTPVHVAAHDGHMGTVQLLVADGAAVNTRNENGETALDPRFFASFPLSPPHPDAGFTKSK